MILTARIFTWAFFLLIVDQTLVIMGFKFGFPIKPSIAYAIIAAGLLAVALMQKQPLQRLMAAKGFFLPFAAIVLLTLVMYRGENPGPDFDQMILPPVLIPSSISYALWPAMNLLASAALFILAARKEIRRTIVLAAFVALIIQVAAMEADMWWPAIFGDANGRAGGLARNANVAAFLVITLASLTLSTRLAPYAVVLAMASVLLSQSKAGGIAACALALAFLFSRPRGIDRKAIAFAASIVLTLAATVMFSPVLNPTPEQIAEAARRAAVSDRYQLPVATLDRPVTLEQRFGKRISVDESANLRREAAAFFLGVVKDHPFGLGTGFTNRFTTGPHNTILKLAVDNGVIAALPLLALLGWLLWRSYATRSATLIALTSVALAEAMFAHTLIVDPIVLPAIGATLGLIDFRSSRNLPPVQA